MCFYSQEGNVFHTNLQRIIIFDLDLYSKIMNLNTFGYKKSTDGLKLPPLKNPTFPFDLSQIQVVSFQCNHRFLFKTTMPSNMDLKLSFICRCLLYLIGFIFIQKCRNLFCIYVLLSHTSFSTGTRVFHRLEKEKL